MATTEREPTLAKVGKGWRAVTRAGKYPGDHPKAGDDIQFRLTLHTPDKNEALARLRRINAMRDALVRIGRGDEAKYLMRKAGEHASDEAAFQKCLDMAGVAATLPTASEARQYKTWADLADAWASGEAHRKWPTEVDAKTSGAFDQMKIDYLRKYIGNVQLSVFSKADYFRAMRNLPPDCKTSRTRRHYAQVVLKVVRIAVQLEIIPAWPLGSVKLPKIDKREAPAYPYLYPHEVRALLSCQAIPLHYRVLWGFIICEGPRIKDVRRIGWRHLTRLPSGEAKLQLLDPKGGRVLDWVMRVGTLAALELLRDLPIAVGRGKAKVYPDGPFAWLTPSGANKAALKLRDHLKLAGVTRDALHENDGRARRLREHDCRSTFVTLAFLEGRNEKWIMTRTGHTTSAQLHGYDRAGGSEGHGFEPLSPLAEMVAGPAKQTPPAPGGEPGAGASEPASGVPEAAGCDTSRDTLVATALVVDVSTGESSVINARCASRGSNPDALRRWNLKPQPSHGNAQTPGVSDVAHDQEPAGTGQVSRVGVTPETPADPYLAGLRLAAHTALDRGDRAKLDRVLALIEEATPRPATVTALHPLKGGRS